MNDARRPATANSTRASPLRSWRIDRSITVLPKPRRVGGFTAGPAVLGPVDREAPERIERGRDLDPAAIVAQRAVFGRIGDHLVDHQCHRGECLRFDQHIRTVDDDAIRLVGKVGAGFRVDQAAKRGRPPIVGGDLIVRHRQRVDAPRHPGEELHVGRPILALGDDATDQAQDVADAMIELRDQQFLPLLRARRSVSVRSDRRRITSSKLTRSDFPMRHSTGSQGGDCPLTVSRQSSKLLRGVSRAPCGPRRNRLRRIAGPVHAAGDLPAQEDQIVARGP